MAEADATAVADIQEQIKGTQRAMVEGLVEEAKKLGLNSSLIQCGGTETNEAFWRYLRQTDWNLENSLELIKAACEWHERNGSQLASLLQETFSKQPGLFSLRQIGHDKQGRPVLFVCFAQSSATVAEHTVDSVISFAQSVVENACRTNKQEASGEEGKSCILIVDCSGLQPKAVLKPTMLVKTHQTLTMLYPNTIESILLFNYNQETRNTWKELKGYIDEGLASKVKFVAMQNVSPTLITKFPADVGQWLREEIAANKSKPVPEEQVHFWQTHSPHDPRAAPSYIADYIDMKNADHKPHPGILYGGQ
ncbi:uncharacterized protein LOC135831057 [Sycon ciliatum]|uniref:uncharacterized protein LOC135831057 n=1 Tax=Sycon ciliatum TaxID=27933 RepID=UPI0031F6A8D0|eukprot:scpid25354/ scgid6394/ 